MRGYSGERSGAGKNSAGGTENCSGVPIFCLQGNGIDRADTAGCNGKGWTEDVSYTLNTIDRPAVMAFAQNQRDEVRDLHGVTGALAAEPGMKQQTYIFDMTHANDVIRESRDVSPSLQARMGTGGNQIPLTYGIGNGQVAEAASMAEEVAQTLNTMHDAQAILRFQSASEQHVMERMVVRRLTPLECTRLQGFPDGWVDIGDWTDEKDRVHKEADAPKYKALGNSIALPFWHWMFGRMAAYLPEGATLGSLFSGIGGFELCWERIHGKGTAIRASEIEPFAIAVTKHHFGGESGDDR